MSQGEEEWPFPMMSNAPPDARAVVQYAAVMEKIRRAQDRGARCTTERVTLVGTRNMLRSAGFVLTPWQPPLLRLFWSTPFRENFRIEWVGTEGICIAGTLAE
jgi:hypothetical protein